ncbi:hypothetical protein J6590_087413 [Homalodisca vitripennis]|nr:hypothetical protein J6590_087413 [Homalodisca vitripennis]
MKEKGMQISGYSSRKPETSCTEVRLFYNNFFGGRSTQRDRLEYKHTTAQQRHKLNIGIDAIYFRAPVSHHQQ